MAVPGVPELLGWHGAAQMTGRVSNAEVGDESAGTASAHLAQLRVQPLEGFVVVVNIYLQTIADAKAAADSLKAMEAGQMTFPGKDDQQITGWCLAELGRNDHTWPDGDWREESTQAVVDDSGQLWIHLTHASVQESLDGTRQHRSYETLTKATGEYLRLIDSEEGAFRKVRAAITKLI